MENISFDSKSADFMVRDEEISLLKDSVLCAKSTLLGGKAPGNNYCGWIDLPVNYDKDEFYRIKKAADKIISTSEVLLVIGIGGSYLGARAAIDFVKGSMYNQLPKTCRSTPEIYYVGSNISTDYTNQIIDILGDRDFSINVISKSGTTTEPAIAFRIFKDILIKKYGEDEANKRIYATTDKARGALKTQADNLGYETFVVPDDVGGRYSVLTAVGLLPIACAGIDIEELMKGAAMARTHCLEDDFENNDSLQYVAYRHALLRKSKNMEILVNYDPALHYVSEWWKQLFGESEGKDQKGIFPASVDFTTDLHSLGQFIQDGTRFMFETVLDIQKSNTEIKMTKEEGDLDGLNYLYGKDMHDVNNAAMNATALAHIDGGTPSLFFHCKERDAFTLGQLFYMFEFSCGVSGYLLGVNPFNQPGVEGYKKNMFKLLGKPGY